MKFEKPLLHGTFIKRYKRFFTDITLDSGETIVAHCPNTGSMQGLKEEGFGAWVTHNNDPKRKLQYTLEIIETPTSWVGVNTNRPNKLVAKAILDGTISELSGYESLKPEVKYGENSRIDILLTSPEKPDCYVEVKNVTLCELNVQNTPVARFPDAVTTRGTKHLLELENMVKQGKRAVMVYLVQRSDCKHFEPAIDIDPTYAKTLKQVTDAGVEALCYACTLTQEGIFVTNQLKVEI